MLQVTVWGDYGRIEGRKVFMGVAQILLDDLDLSNIVIGWYKLFGTASLVSLPPTQPGSTSSTSTSGGTATTATTTPSSSSQQQSSSSKNLKNRSGQHSFDSVGWLLATPTVGKNFTHFHVLLLLCLLLLLLLSKMPPSPVIVLLPFSSLIHPPPIHFQTYICY